MKMPTWFNDYLKNLSEKQADELTDWLDEVDLGLIHMLLTEAIICIEPPRTNPKYYTSEALKSRFKLPEE